MKNIALVFAFLFLLISACNNKDKKGGNTLVTDTSQTKVLVLCEGTFMWGNASLDVFYPKTNKVVNDLYKTQNAGKPLGDVLQSALMAEGLIWLVLNNSGKIIAINPQDYTFKKEIKGFKSPRYMAQFDNKFWVTDIYDNQLSILGTTDNVISHRMKLPGWSEQILSKGGELLVCNHRGRLFFIDPMAEKIKDSLVLLQGAQWMAEDKNGKVWVLASDSGKSALYQIDATNRKVLKTLAMGAGKSATRLAMSLNKDTLFYLSNGVYALAISDNQLPAAPILSEGSASFYALGADPFTGEVYVGNARDYVSKGETIVINSSGKELRRFSTGISPASYLFYR